MSQTTTIKVGESAKTITLPEGKSLVITGSAGAAGVAYLLDPVLGGTNSLKSWAVGTGALAPIGPYTNSQKIRVHCSAGTIDATVQEAVLTVVNSGSTVATITGTPGINNTLTATLPAGVVGTLQWTRTTKAVPPVKSNIASAVANAVNSLTYVQQQADVGCFIGCDASNQVSPSSLIDCPASVPDAPTIGTLTASANSVSQAFTAPANNGGAAITNYQLSVYRASDNVLLGQANGSGSPIALAGLTNGVAVYGKVAAQNSIGIGAQSAASNTATPAAIQGFSSTQSYPAGQQVLYAGGLYTFTANHPAGNWTGADVTYNGQNGSSPLNTAGVSKLLGVVGFGVGSISTTAVASPTTSRGMKMTMEAPFTKLKALMYQREPSPIRGMAFSVAATETDKVDTISNAVDPIVGGVAYSVLRANDTRGFLRLTWSSNQRSRPQAPGAASPIPVNYITNMSVEASDWANCNSVPVVTGRLPMLVARYNRVVAVGDAESNASGVALQTQYNLYNSGSPRGRLMYHPVVGTNGDHVADPTLSKSTAVLYDPTTTAGFWKNMAWVAEHGIPTRNFAGFGDSITEGYQWWQNAVLDLSTQTAPCYVMNFGCSSNRSNQYLGLMHSMIREPENRITDVILEAFSSNEPSNTIDVNTADIFIAELSDAIDAAFARNMRIYVWTSYAAKTQGYNGANAIACITKINNWVRNNAGPKFQLVEIEAGWNNSTMIAGDNTHPNATGIAYMSAQILPIIQRGV
ncbi:hypothetical protein GTP55_25650 [Duganella sp. FT109W]|uniref:Fibronectin type-III domain-containing protein n=1 Tax=Duganella margarita TaxID=2692170 RepID=A0ABW9WNI5_9BURK|nr:SGNH/GDSL hydrolase family protein [Duganella margarita]MYN42733.1 hypothetical protein [Duganella margarita]